jgi:hypothetical protein
MWAAPFQCTVPCPLWLSLASIGRIKGVAVLAVMDFFFGEVLILWVSWVLGR